MPEALLPGDPYVVPPLVQSVQTLGDEGLTRENIAKSKAYTFFERSVFLL